MDIRTLRFFIFDTWDLEIGIWGFFAVSALSLRSLRFNFLLWNRSDRNERHVKKHHAIFWLRFSEEYGIYLRFFASLMRFFAPLALRSE